MTIATGELSESDADQLGLVPTHAYAVIGKAQNMIEAKRGTHSSFRRHQGRHGKTLSSGQESLES